MIPALYRLLSNTTTIVRKEQDYARIFWSDTMARGYSSEWMMHRWNQDNVEKLTDKEAAEVVEMRLRWLAERGVVEPLPQPKQAAKPTGRNALPRQSRTPLEVTVDPAVSAIIVQLTKVYGTKGRVVDAAILAFVQVKQ